MKIWTFSDLNYVYAWPWFICIHLYIYKQYCFWFINYLTYYLYIVYCEDNNWLSVTENNFADLSKIWGKPYILNLISDDNIISATSY